MKQLLLRLGLACALTLLLSLSPIRAEDYETWHDPTYDFHHVRHLYIDTLDVPPSAASHAMKVHTLNAYLLEQSKELEGWTVTLPDLPPPVPNISRHAAETQSISQQQTASSAERQHVSSSDPAAGLPDSPAPSAQESVQPSSEAGLTTPALPQNQPEDQLPAEALSADVYIKATLLAYTTRAELVPAHTEWNIDTVRDVVYDRRGNPHWISRDIRYPVYVPDTYIPIATVGVQFIIYDVKTGKAVFMSEDMRSRSSSDDLYGIYKRIVDRFYKNLKKDLES